jgi:Core-2/I-Branching enzyme
MRMAHIIMAYKDPPQIERLVKKMSHSGFDFYIHVDSKFDQAPFEYLLKIPRVFFIKRRAKIRWAGFSFTQTLINCIEEVLETGNQYDFINALSGQDYPVKPIEYLYEFFESRMGQSFLAIEKFGSPWWSEAEQRIVEYHMTDFDFKGRYKVQFLLNLILPKRKFPYGYTLYGSNRATWWTMHTGCAAFVVKFMKEHPKMAKFAKYTWAPDEYLIPTIIMNSSFKETVVPDNYRYVDWSRGGPNPKILTVEDFEALEKTEKLIARKFDFKVDTKILDMIDAITK